MSLVERLRDDKYGNARLMATRNQAADEIERLNLIISNQAIGNERRDAEIERLEGALELYADPSFYHAIAIMADRPAGGFADDFSEGHGEPHYDRPMPGKAAREALNKDQP